MTFRAGTCWILALALVPTVGSRAWADEKEGAKSLAHIKLSGIMEEGVGATDPLFGSLEESFKTKLDRIHKARKDKNVAALLLEIDGPTLGLARIEELCRAISEVRKSGKKVFAFMDSGMTGTYLI